MEQNPDLTVEKVPYSVESTSIRYGLYTAGGLIAYFLIMKLLGLIHVIELRALNLVILVGGILMALRYFKKKNEIIEYLQGIGLGLLTSAVAVVTFALFVFIYLQIDGDFLMVIKQKESFGEYMNPYILAFVVALEGIASGFIATFVIMQYLKRQHLTNK